VIVLQRVRPATLPRKRETSNHPVALPSNGGTHRLGGCHDHPLPPCRGTCGSVRLVRTPPTGFSPRPARLRSGRASLVEVAVNRALACSRCRLRSTGPEVTDERLAALRSQARFGGHFALCEGSQSRHSSERRGPGGCIVQSPASVVTQGSYGPGRKSARASRKPPVLRDGSLSFGSR
jgi:hypothetical protein